MSQFLLIQLVNPQNLGGDIIVSEKVDPEAPPAGLNITIVL